MKKRVAVIGAGPAGLATLRELLALGHDAVAFERQPHLGGVYATHYDELQLTSGRVTTAFGSYSDGTERTPRMWTGPEYLAYLNGYASHFSLHPRIHLSTNVDTLRLDSETGTWTLHASSVTATQSAESAPAPPSASQTFEFDHVAICSGVHTCPVRPPLPGIERFQGTLLHSSEVPNAEVFRGRRVLVIGLGEGGSDIALMAATVAESCVISTRQGAGYIIPRYSAGKPTDLDTNRCYHAIPRWLLAHPVVRLKTKIEDLYLRSTDDKQVLRKAKELNKTRGRSPFQRFGTKNTSFVEAIVYHDATYKPEVASIGADCVEFIDGTSEACDLIVCCTGYAPVFPFLEQHHPNLSIAARRPRAMYKHMIQPELGTRAAWIGLVRPGLGSIPPLAEMQARYFALLVSGERTLPSTAEMDEDTERAARLDQEQYPDDAGRLNALTDHLRFLDGMATVIGCQPPLRKLFFSEPMTWAKVMFGPLNGAQFRLAGPGAEPVLARQILSRVPTMPWPVLAWEAIFLLGSKILYALGAGERFKPIGV